MRRTRLTQFALLSACLWTAGLLGPQRVRAEEGAERPAPPPRHRLILAAGETAAAVPKGKEELIVALISELGYAAPLEGGYTFDSIQIDRKHLVYRLRTVAPEGEGQVVGELILAPAAAGEAADLRSKSFAMAAVLFSDDPLVQAHLEAAQRSVQAHDPGDFFHREVRQRRAPVPVQPGAEGAQGPKLSVAQEWGLRMALLALLVALAGVGLFGARGGPRDQGALVEGEPDLSDAPEEQAAAGEDEGDALA